MHEKYSGIHVETPEVLSKNNFRLDYIKLNSSSGGAQSSPIFFFTT